MNLTDEQAVDIALSFSELQRRVVLLCGKNAFPSYRQMANELDTSYECIQQVGRALQKKKLAFVQPIRDGLDNYAGSALFLNQRGQQVRHVVELQNKMRSSK